MLQPLEICFQNGGHSCLLTFSRNGELSMITIIGIFVIYVSNHHYSNWENEKTPVSSLVMLKKMSLSQHYNLMNFGDFVQFNESRTTAQR